MAIDGCGGVSGRAAAGPRLALAHSFVDLPTSRVVERRLDRAVDGARLETTVVVAKCDCRGHHNNT